MGIHREERGLTLAWIERKTPVFRGASVNSGLFGYFPQQQGPKERTNKRPGCPHEESS